MRKQKRLQFEFVCLIFEKYGFNVIPAQDNKTIWIVKSPDLAAAVPFTDIEEILEKEELDAYIKDILPIYLNSWKIEIA